MNRAQIERALSLACLAAVVGAPLGAAAAPQEACKMEQLKSPPTLAEIYAKASAHAKAWKPDAVPARVGVTSLGPLRPDGRSEAWNLMFFSESAKSWMSVTTFRGMYTCYSDTGTAGRIPALKPDFFRDGAKLYALAKEHGDEFIAQGYQVSIDTAAAPSNNHAMWYINYQKDNRNAKLSVILDANTGVVEKIIRD
jgi:hypothetical protein